MTKEQAAEQLYPYEKTERKSLKQFDWEEGFEAGAEWQEQQFAQLIEAAREAKESLEDLVERFEGVESNFSGDTFSIKVAKAKIEYLSSALKPYRSNTDYCRARRCKFNIYCRDIFCH